MRLDPEILGMIFDFYLAGASLPEKLELRLVDRCRCKDMTEQVLGPFYAHIIVKGHDFSEFRLPRWIGKGTAPLIQHLEVQLKCAETRKEPEEQLWEYHSMISHFLEECKNIRSIKISFDKPLRLVQTPSNRDDIDKDWDFMWEGVRNFPLFHNEYHDHFLDETTEIIRWFATKFGGRRYIQIHLQCCSTSHDECMIACAGRNKGVVVGQDRGGENKMVLQSAHSPDGQPPAAGDRPGSSSHFRAKQACRAMRYILHKYLATLPPGLDHQPQRWGFLADQMYVQQDMLLGASTAAAPKFHLFVPISIRGPFQTAISELSGAIRGFERAAWIGDHKGLLDKMDKPHENFSHEMQILEAKACITRALAALEPACAAEDALSGEVQSGNGDGSDEGSRRPSTNDGQDGSDNGSDKTGDEHDEHDEDRPYYVYSAYKAVNRR